MVHQQTIYAYANQSSVLIVIATHHYQVSPGQDVIRLLRGLANVLGKLNCKWFDKHDIIAIHDTICVDRYECKYCGHDPEPDPYEGLCMRHEIPLDEEGKCGECEFEYDCTDEF